MYIFEINPLSVASLLLFSPNLEFIFKTEVLLIYNISGVQQSDSVIHICYFSDSYPLWVLQDTEYSSLCYTVGPCYLSIIYILFV